MRIIVTILIVLFSISFIGCKEGGKTKSKEKTSIYKRKKEIKKQTSKKQSSKKASETIDLSNKGIGPIKSINLDDNIDISLAKKGEETFNKLCVACHKVGKKLIGPAPNGILKRRTPEWVMNIILNPEEMLEKDPLAKSLLEEYNNIPMLNQNVTEEQARAILEYFRTLD